MRVLLVYDEALEPGGAGELPPDIGREFETAETVAALLAAVEAAGHTAAKLPLNVDFFEQVSRIKPDLVFNIAEGLRGAARESIVPAWLEHLGIPYTGSDGLTMAVSLDKALTKEIAAARGVRTPAFRRLRNPAQIETVDLPFPLFVKPNAEGSNMGVYSSSLVQTPDELAERAGRILAEYPGDCLVETFAPGREFCIGLLGNGSPRVLAPAEVCTEADLYARKHAPLRHREMICPVELPAGLVDEMVSASLEVFEALGCRDLARMDFMLDVDGRPSFLEVNPLPSLAPATAVYPLQAKAAGVGYDELIAGIIEAAVRRCAAYRPGESRK